ncbi:MAG TPA: MATE family efflux transporter [Stellaceae bacterium]
MPAPASAIRAEIRATLALAAPLAGANLAQMAMGLTNAIVVGRLGGGALAAAGLGAGFYFTLVMICQGVLVAVAPLAAHAIGAGDERAAARVAGAGMALAALMALPVFLLLTIAPQLLVLLGYQQQLAADIADFLSAIRWASPAFLGFAVLRGMLSAAGRVRAIMFAVLFAVPANAVLNGALVFGHFGLPALGIVGSGFATAIIQWVMTLGLAAYTLLLPGRRFRMLARGDLARIVRVGLPISGMLALEVGVFNAAGVLMGLLGAQALGAHQLAINFASLSFMVPLGIAQAATVRVAYELGAGAGEAARRAGLVALALGGVLMLAPSLLMLAIPWTIAGIYLDLGDPGNQGTAIIAVRLLAIAAAFQVFDGVQVIALGALRGYRDTAVPMLIGAFGYWAAGFAMSWALAFPLGYGAVGLWWGLALGLGIVALLLTWRLHHRSRVAEARVGMAEAQALPG